MFKYGVADGLRQPIYFKKIKLFLILIVYKNVLLRARKGLEKSARWLNYILKKS
jgi:hypothetical protein